MLVLGVVAASLGSAHAGTSTKFYGASVHRTPASCDSGTCFTLTLTNDVKSSQTLGSVNFNAPSGWSASIGSTQDITTADGHRWHVIADGSNVVKFRAFSSKDSLPPGQSVTANVGTTVRCDLSANVARWTTQAKQSNDFSGQPGNDFQLNAADLTPLGSFSIPVATRITGQLFTQSAIADDTCGQPKTDYSSATATLAHTLLTRATFAPASGLNVFAGGVGTVDITPAVSETGITLTVSDSSTGVTSTSDPFNVVDVLCTSGACHGQDSTTTPLTLADSTVPSGGSLGLGFNNTLSFSCSNVTTQVGSFTNIDPSGYTGPFKVTLTYSKSVSGSRPAAGFVVCISDTMGTAWQSPLLACATVPVAPCVLSKKRTNSGDLQVVLYLDPTDPWIGTG